jgi:putative intracellular protease/amidase
MNVAIPLFDHFTALDAIGPYEVLSRIPGAKVTFVGERRGVVRTDIGSLGVEVTATFDELSFPDVLVVPGGPRTDLMTTNAALLAYVTRAHERTQWTTSVCTGSLVLGAAGLLRGLRATTHWRRIDKLEGYGATAANERVVFQGKIVTAAGVSAGIDMALSLAARIAGVPTAQAIQLGIEYAPEPPFQAGSPATAPAEIVEMILARARAEASVAR